MLKGYRGSVLALVVSFILLGTVVLTRPPEPTPDPSVIQTSIPVPTATGRPTLTPAPTIPFQQLNTSELNEAVIGCVKKLNPLLVGYNQTDRDVSSLIFEGLFTTDTYGLPAPELAASWAVSNDGLVYVVNLRPDVLWQDGQPFTSDDVLFTIHLMQDNNFPGLPELRNFWQTVDVDAIDAHTVRFKLAQPLSAFLDYLRVGILPSHVLKGVDAETLVSHPFNLSPIGTGPYQFDGLLGNGSQLTGVRLRFAATFSQRPEGKEGYALKEIVFHCEPSFNDAIAAFQNGDVDSIGELPADAPQQVVAISQLTVYSAYRPAFGAVIFNWQRSEVSFFRDFRMRQALVRSVDRDTLVNKYLAGRAVPANSPIVPLSWAYNPNLTCPTYDNNSADLAKQYLSQVQIIPTVPPSAGLSGPTPMPSTQDAATSAATQPATSGTPSGGTAANYHFQVLVDNDPALAGMASEIVSTWDALGLSVNVVVVDTSTFKERLTAGNFDAALVELNLAPNADPDPYSLWRQVPADGGLNFGGMDDRPISELVEQARREVNGLHRADLYKQFQQLFCDRAAALLLYYPMYYFGADKRITGIQLGFMSSPSDRFRTIKDWRFIQP